MAKFRKASDIRVGVIGYGGAFNMGKAHLNEMKQAGMTPVAACDVDPKRVEVAKGDFPGIQTYTDVGAMLAKSNDPASWDYQQWLKQQSAYGKKGS